MRVLFWVVCGLALALGLIFGALNGQPVAIDLYFAQYQLSVGSALLAALLLGALLAGLCLGLAVIWPLQARLRRAERRVLATPTGDALIETTSGDT